MQREDVFERAQHVNIEIDVDVNINTNININNNIQTATHRPEAA